MDLPGGKLKLRFREKSDLATLSALLQDALVPLSDLAYLKRQHRFVMVVNRFRWERARPLEESAQEADARFEDDVATITTRSAPYERVNCGVCFDEVWRVRSRGVDMAARDQLLNLLALRWLERDIVLEFSDGGVIRLQVDRLHCHLEDLGEPWPTPWRPDHADDEEAKGAVPDTASGDDVPGEPR
jgi:hypothetical protein